MLAEVVDVSSSPVTCDVASPLYEHARSDSRCRERVGVLHCSVTSWIIVVILL
jgi:hypothetical protein